MRNNANSVIASLNKWMQARIGPDYTIHSFRHSMRDRLRAVECPSDVIDQIGAGLTPGIGANYGNGFKIKITFNWLVKVSKIQSSLMEISSNMS